MFKKPFFKKNLGFALAAALIYCIPVFFFIRQADYTQTWLLYLGNFLFMGVIIAFLFYTSRVIDNRPGPLSLIVAGQKEVVLGIVISCLLSFVLLVILVRGLFGAGMAGKYLADKPANTMHGKTNGLVFMVLMNSLIGNFVTGAFMSLMLPASLKRKRAAKAKSSGPAK